jgi:hypothetical protein
MINSQICLPCGVIVLFTIVLNMFTYVNILLVEPVKNYTVYILTLISFIFLYLGSCIYAIGKNASLYCSIPYIIKVIAFIGIQFYLFIEMIYNSKSSYINRNRFLWNTISNLLLSMIFETLLCFYASSDINILINQVTNNNIYNNNMINYSIFINRQNPLNIINLQTEETAIQPISYYIVSENNIPDKICSICQDNLRNTTNCIVQINLNGYEQDHIFNNYVSEEIINNNPNGVVRLSCGDAFHVGCIDQWVRTNRKCPNCRQSV